MSNSILKELPELIEKKIISEEVAQNIKDYYQKNPNNSNKLFTVFGILGALLGGLGVILILAHNWDDFSVVTKTILSFIPLLIGQIACFYSLKQKESVVSWCESSATFLFFAIAASISLIAQVYNIHGDFGNFLLTWMLLSLPLVYLMPSSFVSLLYIGGITWYCVYTNYNVYPKDHNFYYWGLLVLILPHYLKLTQNHIKSNFTNFHHWFLALSIIICFGSISEKTNYLMLIGYSSLLGLFYFLSKAERFKNLSTFRNGFYIISKIGLLFLLFWLSFKFFWEQYKFETHWMSFDSIIYLSVFLICLFFAFKYSKKKHFINQNPIAFSFLAIVVFYFLNQFVIANLLVGLANIYILLIGVFEINEGAKNNSLFKLNFGLIIIAILILCRFFDTEMSFVVRGILFILIGFGFFSLNYYLLKKRVKNEK